MRPLGAIRNPENQYSSVLKNVAGTQTARIAGPGGGKACRNVRYGVRRVVA
jgi:hypothetical protein